MFVVACAHATLGRVQFSIGNFCRPCAPGVEVCCGSAHEIRRWTGLARDSVAHIPMHACQVANLLQKLLSVIALLLWPLMTTACAEQ